jgi:hypothetical protein
MHEDSTIALETYSKDSKGIGLSCNISTQALTAIYSRLIIIVSFTILLNYSFASAQTLQISKDSRGTTPNDVSSNASISSDSAYIAFASKATNLVNNDTNGVTDIFIHHQTMIPIEDPSGNQGQTNRLSVSSTGTQANGASHSPSLSSNNARFIAFVSAADNLVDNDTNGVEDIFIHDRTLAQTYRISVPHDISGTVQGESNGNSFSPHISADGCFVVFASDATNLNATGSDGVAIPDTNGKRDVFLYYNPNGEGGCNGGTPYIELISVAPGNTSANDDSYAPYFSSIRFITFSSKATNLTNSDTNGFPDIFLRDRAVNLQGVEVDRKTTLISTDSNGNSGNGESFSSSMNGPDIVFDSVASNLVSNDNNGKRDIFKHSLITDSRSGGTTVLVSQTTNGEQGNGDSFSPNITAGSNYVAFASDATNLSIDKDCNDAADIFVRDYILGTLRRVNFTTAGYQTASGLSSSMPSIANGGLLVAYQTSAKLNQSDDNDIQDIYVSVASEDPSKRNKPLSRDKKLAEEPDVCVEQKSAVVRMEFFSDVKKNNLTSSSRSKSSSFPCKGAGLCYQVEALPVTTSGKLDRKRTRTNLVSRRNTLTIPKLKAGNYAVSFRVFGKSGSKVLKTNQSPKRIITVK